MRPALALLALAGSLLTAAPSCASQQPTSQAIADAPEAIVRRIDNLVPAPEEQPRPRQALNGIVEAIDQRNDRITLRLSSDASEDFKVQDGLVFDVVHNGDHVDVTVETIGGADTIVGLIKR